MTPLTAEVREVERVRRPDSWAAVRIVIDPAEGVVGVAVSAGFLNQAAADRCAARLLAAGHSGVAVVRIPRGDHMRHDTRQPMPLWLCILAPFAWPFMLIWFMLKAYFYLLPAVVIDATATAFGYAPPPWTQRRILGDLYEPPPEPELLKQLRGSVALLNTETTNEG